MIDRTAVHEAFNAAREAVQGIEDAEYRKIAFEVLFRRLLDSTPSGGPVPPERAALAAGLLSERSTLGEFLASLAVKSYGDRVAAIAYYSLHGQQREAVTRKDFLDGLSKARIPKPKNISDVIAQCIRKGHLMDAPEPKDGQRAWQITRSGEKHVQEKLRTVEP